MKKVLIAAMLILTMLMLTACGEFTCGLCQQTKTGKKHTVNTYGLEMTVCDNCYQQMNALGSLLTGIQ